MGLVAARALTCAGENNVVHGLAAHSLGAIGTHDPANGLEEIGFAAAIGADNTRQARLNDKISRLYKGLKARQRDLFKDQ